MRGREVFMDALRLHGVNKIFGNPGTTETPLLDSLIDYPDLEYIFHLHEGIAVGAANLYTQASGNSTVANMHVAPGLGNAIGMIYGALKNNSPLIVTAGAQDTRLRLRDPLLGHDLAEMAKPVTKWSVQVEHADEMAAIMQRAFKIANEHPAGPVFVALPINVMEQETELGAVKAGNLTTRGKAGTDSLMRMADLIKNSRNPGIVAGDDVVRGGAVQSLIALSEKIGAGVHLELVSGMFPFPSKHPHYRGRLGADAVAFRDALGDYDLVLLIGGPFFEEVWYSDVSPFAESTALVQLEASASRLAHNYPLALGIAGDIADALTQLSEFVGDQPIYKERCQALAGMHDAVEENMRQRFTALKDRSPMSPSRALYEIGQAVPDDVVITDESITASADVIRNFDTGGSHEFYSVRGGGIGQGLAGCLGVAVAHRDRQIIAISGDGSAMYSIQALWTAAHHHLNIIFVILSNREYRVLKHNAEHYRRRFDAVSNKPYPHMDLNRPFLGFTEMASGMGVPAKQVSNPDDLAAAVAEGLTTNGPYLLDVIVEGLETR